MSSSARFIFDNAADRAAITATTAAAGLGAANLQNDIKGQVCRLTGDAGQIVLTWPTPQTVGAVVIPASSLGGSSTIRVRGYADAAGTDALIDTGVRWAAPGGILEHWDWSQPLNVNSFAWTFPPVTAVYFEHVAVRRIVIDLTDPGAEFMDLSRLVMGRVLATQYNASYGQSDGIIDATKNERTASGDLRTELGPKAKTLGFSLDCIRNSERAQIKQLCSMGVGRSVFVSLCAQNGDPEKERDKSCYGKLRQPSAMTWTHFGLHQAAFEVEGF